MNKYESEQLLKKKINEKNKKKFYRNNMYMCKCMCIYMYVCMCMYTWRQRSHTGTEVIISHNTVETKGPV